MKISFTASPRKGNNAGCGFFYLPDNKVNLFNLEDEITVEMENEIKFPAKIVMSNRKFGVYIPKNIFL